MMLVMTTFCNIKNLQHETSTEMAMTYSVILMIYSVMILIMTIISKVNKFTISEIT